MFKFTTQMVAVTALVHAVDGGRRFLQDDEPVEEVPAPVETVEETETAPTEPTEPVVEETTPESEPVTEEPATEDTPTKDPVTEEPTAEEEPVTEEPAAEDETTTEEPPLEAEETIEVADGDTTGILEGGEARITSSLTSEQTDAALKDLTFNYVKQGTDWEEIAKDQQPAGYKFMCSDGKK
jgi:carbonic anhydrase